jgi:MFS family permease
MVTAAPGTRPRGPSWLEGPLPDLSIGAGGAYLLSVPLLWLSASGALVSDWTFTPVWIIAILINGPHYGATLLRVYEQREERRRYALFSIWGTLLFAGIFVVGLYEHYVGSLIVMIYMSWSPWHFAGQNYGISVMFLRRAGIEVPALAKRLLHTSFVLSFLLAFLALHAQISTGLQAPPRGELYTDPVVVRLGIPAEIGGGLILAFAAGYLLSVVGALTILRRHSTFRVVVPLISLILCQALWFVVLSLLDVTGAWSTRSLAFAAIWISSAHSTQYLWVTFHYAKRSVGSTRLRDYLLRTTLAGNAAIVMPGVVFAPMLLGASLNWEQGLGTLIFASVNLHHFMLDGAVWKLREGKVARRLLRDGAEPARTAASGPKSRLRRLSIALWAFSSVCLAIEVVELARHQAQYWGAHRLAKTMFDALGWAGREHPIERIRFGRALLKEGDFEGARIEFQRSLQAFPSVAGWGGVGRSLDGEFDFSRAAGAYEKGLAVDPGDTALLRSAALARSKLGEYERAIELLNRALDREPENPVTRQMLKRVKRNFERSVEPEATSLREDGSIEGLSSRTVVPR